VRIHSYTFPYVRFHERHYPLIPITLSRGPHTVNTFALLDSGASISVFRPELIKPLGLINEKHKPYRLGTATGNVDIEVHRVTVTIEETKFKSKIGFSKKHVPSFNILGREGFFTHFSVCFNEIMKTVILVPIDHASNK